MLVVVAVSDSVAVEVYSNDFNAPLGTKFPEWTSSNIRYRSAADPPGAGEAAPQVVTNCESPNGTQRFLGEFGGPKFGTSVDPDYNRTLVEQTICLKLRDLPPHRTLRLSFDLYVLKSWDGNSPQYGPDRLRIAVVGGPILLDTSFSNNHKVDRQGSYQDHPQPKSQPQTAALSTNTLAFDFFGDAIYHFEFTFPHDHSKVQFDVTSSLFEGKGKDDESWGIDNVKIATMDRTKGEPDAARNSR
ncbi:MAG: hypothetical protein WD971_09770 [Pirellulales bacterium]